MALTPQQEIFKNNLLKGMGQQEAYLAVPGYTNNPKAAESGASRLLLNDKFRKEYDAALERAANKAEATKERVLREECRLAYSDLRRLFVGETIIAPHELPEDVARSVSSVEVVERINISNDEEITKERRYKYRFWDKGKSLERLSKHLGLYEKDNTQKAPKIDSISINLVSTDGKTQQVDT